MSYEETQVNAYEYNEHPDPRSPDEPKKRKRDSPSSLEDQDTGMRGSYIGTAATREDGYADPGSPPSETQEEEVEDEGQGIQPANLEERMVELLPVVLDGLKVMAERKQAVHAQLAELTEEGLAVFDAARKAFLKEMNRVKEAFDKFQETEKQKWLDCSQESQEAEEKLQQVANLVNQLNASAGSTANF